MKKSLLFLGMVLSLVSHAALAEVNLPVVAPPIGFEEGTETRLSPEQVSEIMPWAMNSEIALKDLKERVKSLSLVETKQLLTDEISKIVEASSRKQTELLMRYVLNRALKISRDIEQDSNVQIPGVVASQVKLLSDSVDMAIAYYKSDVEFLNGRVNQVKRVVNPPFARFGTKYSGFLMNVGNNLQFARSQYQLMIVTLGLLQWDLYRDINKAAFAPAIAKIQATLASLPEQATGTDAQIIGKIRSLKKAYAKVIELVGVTLARTKVADEIAELALRPITDLKVTQFGLHRHDGGGCAAGYEVAPGAIADAGGGNPYGNQIACIERSLTSDVVVEDVYLLPDGRVSEDLPCAKGYEKAAHFVDCTFGSCKGLRLFCEKKVRYFESKKVLVDFYITHDARVNAPTCKPNYETVGFLADCTNGICSGNQALCALYSN